MLGGTHRSEEEGKEEEGGGVGGWTSTFLLQGVKRQHSVGEEERVVSN